MAELNSIAAPLVIGHRGYSRRYPENTPVAFGAAFAAGAGMVELDVTLTRDREVVVIHDPSVDRTTDGTGPVKSLSLEQLKRLDAGRWFDPRFAGERIPTLEEVLEKFGDRGLVNVEIKAEAFENDLREDGIERKVAAILRKYGLVHRVLISSFELRLLNRVRRLENPPAIGVLTGRRRPPDVPASCRRLRAFSWHPHWRTLDAAQVSAAHDAGLRVFPYTANTFEDIRRLLRMGVDGIFTDDPATASACIAEMKTG